MTEEIFGIKYLFRVCIETKLNSPKLIQLLCALNCNLTCAELQLTGHSSELFFRSGATDLQLALINQWEKNINFFNYIYIISQIYDTSLPLNTFKDENRFKTNLTWLWCKQLETILKTTEVWSFSVWKSIS